MPTALAGRVTIRIGTVEPIPSCSWYAGENVVFEETYACKVVENSLGFGPITVEDKRLVEAGYERVF